MSIYYIRMATLYKMAEIRVNTLRRDAKAACVNGKIIGSGMFGIVYGLGVDCVVKLQFLKELNTDATLLYEGKLVRKIEFAYFTQEVELIEKMKGLEATPILFDAWAYGNRCYMIMERMDGTLLDIFNGLTRSQIDVVIKQIRHINDVFLLKFVSLIDCHLNNILYKVNDGALIIRVGDLGEIKCFKNEYVAAYQRLLSTTESEELSTKQDKHYKKLTLRKSKIIQTVLELLEAQNEFASGEEELASTQTARQLRLKKRVYKKPQSE